MSLMQRADFRKELQAGLYGTFGMTYEDWPVEWTDIFEQDTSEKAYEEEVLLVGLGVAEETAEGASVSFDGGGEAWTSRYVHKKVTKAFAVTEEAVDDNLYVNVSTLYAKSAAKSIRIREEVDGASVLTAGFTRIGPDGVPLFAASHPLRNGGSIGNKLATSADFSEEGLEDACNRISRYTDDRGIPKMIKARKVIVPVEKQFVAERIMNSDGRAGTANNDLNAMKARKAIPDGFSLNHYITDPDAWFVLTDADQGFRYFERKGVKKSTEYEFTTGNMRCKFVKRYSFGVTDWRAGFASEGSPV